MRALPCAYCQELLTREDLPPEQRTRIGSGVARLRDGEPYLIGKTPTKFPFRVWCATCKRATYLTATQFNRLPKVPPPSASTTQTSEES